MAVLKVLLLLLLGLGVSVNSHVSLQKRIIGGQNCDNRERLYYVRLESTKGNERSQCGGSLIHPRWILTAAHCWKSEAGWINIATLKVHPRTAVQQIQVIRQAPEIYTDDGRQHNIILLKLRRPVSGVPLARLPDCNNRLRRNDVVQLAGEGGMTTGPSNARMPTVGIPLHLQCVNMNVVQDSNFLQTPGDIFLTGHIFHASAPKKDISFGDSGGAAIHNGKIYGVISIGGLHFAFSKPTAIMDVCEYLEWIKQKTGIQ